MSLKRKCEKCSGSFLKSSMAQIPLDDLFGGKLWLCRSCTRNFYDTFVRGEAQPDPLPILMEIASIKGMEVESYRSPQSPYQKSKGDPDERSMSEQGSALDK